MRYFFKVKEYGYTGADGKQVKKRVIRAYNMDTYFFIGYIGRRDDKITVVSDFINAIDFIKEDNFQLTADEIVNALHDIIGNQDVSDGERDAEILAILTL